MFKFLLETVRKGGGADLLDFVSPSFFDVVSVGKSTVLMTRMMRDALQPIPLEKKTKVQNSLKFLKIPVTLEASHSKIQAKNSNHSAKVMKPLEWGSLMLKLYFAQVFALNESILDLRMQSFSTQENHLIWSPSNISHTWDPLFIEPMREIYLGFYTNNKAQFRKGLKALNLDSAEELFLAHFGEGDQSQVTFTLNGFRRSFHDIFVHCKEQKIKLHVDFLPLGILLGTLYENLSHITDPLDVRKSFEFIQSNST